MRTLFARSNQLSAVSGAPVTARPRAPGRGLKSAILLPVLGVLAVLLHHVPVQARTAFEEFEAKKSPAIERQACALARWAVERKLLGEKPAKPAVKLHRIFERRAAVFVTMKAKGKPRGCMGTIEPRQEDVAREIIHSAVGAATADRRQKPLALHELKHVTFCISIVGPLKPAQNMSDLAPSRMGLLIRNGSRAGMLLPGEAKTAAWQIAECKRKAGLPPDAPVQMYVFPTVTLEEKARRR